MNRDKIIDGIKNEIDSLQNLYEDIIAFPDIVKSKEINNYDKAAIALMLSQMFNGIENILKRILEINSIKLQSNEQYHIELINCFSENSQHDVGLCFSQDMIDRLSILRRFRHYVFHGYSFHLEWDRLSLAIETLPNVFENFKSNVENYTNSL